MNTGSSLQQTLGLRLPPVGLSFASEPPAGLARVRQPAPAGCGYWKLAAEGGVFYTTADDHHGCPVGAHTHGVELPAAQAEQLTEMMHLMLRLEYLDPAEIPALPRRAAPFKAAVYAPLPLAPVPPDVVLVWGDARQVMLLWEAVRAAGLAGEGAPMGRPACAAVPAVLASGKAATSLGCIGNRVYTALGDTELFVALPGSALPAVEEKLDSILRANRELEAFHQARLRPAGTGDAAG